MPRGARNDERGARNDGRGARNDGREACAIARTILRHCEECNDEAIWLYEKDDERLPRYARNDGRGARNDGRRMLAMTKRERSQ